MMVKTAAARKILLDFMAAAAERTAAKRCQLKDWSRFMDFRVMTRLQALPAGATSFDAEERSATARLSNGSPVKRPYGTEVLRISADAVNLTRLKNGGIPLLDSHNQIGIANALGRFSEVWIESRSLLGKIIFSQTDEGLRAAGMVQRGEIAGISVGYRVEEWEITDQDGRVLDPEIDRIRFDDDLTFTATKWELLEGSLVVVPADPSASVRARVSDSVADVIARAQARQRMHDRQEAALMIAGVRARMSARQRMHDRLQAVLAR